MADIHRVDGRIYVPGRAGELADYTNLLTFSLIEKIFGYQGPYRHVMSEFGFVDPSRKESFLAYLDGRVCSNIRLESEIIWEPCLFHLVCRDEEVRLEFDWKGVIWPRRLLNHTRKTWREISVLSNILGYLSMARDRYTRYSIAVDEIYAREKIELDEFLSIYKDIVWINYLYGLFFQYNNQHGLVKSNLLITKYVQENDYLQRSGLDFREAAYISMGFMLGHVEKVARSDQPAESIPGHLPDLAGLPHSIVAEVQLQCLKNNARLKLAVLLYYLNDTILKKARKRNLSEVTWLRLDEITQTENNNPQQLSRLIEARKETAARTKSDLVKPEANEQNRTYVGVACSPGLAYGKAQWVVSPEEKVSCPILVLPSAAPEFTQQMYQAAGLVFRRGSPLAHGAILARERGVPAVVLDIDAPMHAGVTLRIDGTSGRVWVGC